MALNNMKTQDLIYKSKFDIKQNEDNYLGTIPVASRFYGCVIGKGGVKIKTIQNNTNTIITIPKSKNLELISVEGKSYSSVESALLNIVELVNNARQYNPLTHFFSIPTNNESLKNSFTSFKEKILQSCKGDHVIQENIFQYPQKLHLTLSVLALDDNLEINNTIDNVTQFKETEILFKKPLKIHIKGVDFFGKNSSSVRVLYAKVENTLDRDLLQELADKLQNFLFNQGIIIKKERDSISLHMTLMNISFLKSRQCVNNEEKPIRNFDCTNLINEFVDWDFGQIDVDSIYLSEMSSGGEMNYYTNLASFAMGEI